MSLRDFSWEEQIIISFLGDFSKTHRKKLKKMAIFFQVAIHFNPGHPQLKIINTSFCALVG